MESTEHIFEKAVLVGLNLPDMADGECERSLDELESLLDTAGGEVFGRLTQSKNNPDPATCLGSGKLEELAEICRANDIGLVIFDNELSPMQIRNIEKVLDGARVIDRSMLILDIFALHAVTSEGKLQVELAQLKYSAPRLAGHGSEMSKLGGGIGTRGPGESKLESDRRHLKRKILQLESELRELDKIRLTQRKSRERSEIKKIAVVGYTNAGKSTLMNRLTDAGILAEDKLFATLDPTTRKFTLPCGEDVLITDTVGFIRRLPHHLIKAFKSTLDEAAFSDIILIVIDASDGELAEKTEVTEKLLGELGAGGKPTIYVYNKCDLATAPPIMSGDSESVMISAKKGIGLDELVEKLEKLVLDGKAHVVFRVPNSDAGVISRMYACMTVEDVTYENDAAVINAVADKKARGLFAKYLEKQDKQEDE